MNDLMNRGILYLLCLVPFLHNYLSLHCVVICLAVLSASCLNSFLPGKYVYADSVLYAALAVRFPVLTYFLPLFFYNVKLTDKKSRKIFLLLAGMSVFCFRHAAPQHICYCLLLTLTAVVLQYYKTEIHNTKAQFHQYRDDSVESSLLLKEKHQALLAKQNYEIHVATLTERNRIAREIHDNVGHLLTSSLLQTGALQVVNQDERLNLPLQNLSDTLNTAMTSVRDSVHDLHADSLDMKKALENLLRPITGYEIEFSYECFHEPGKEIRYAFIAISKEAVNNIRKHSNATRIQIRVREHPAFYQLSIADNGTDIKPIRDTGIGLANMRERIENLGGNIHFSTEHGFRILISVMKGERT